MEKTISFEEYSNIKDNIDSMTSEEELIETHKKLIGRNMKSSYYEIKDCGVDFIRILLSLDWGRSIVYDYTDGAKSFIQSKYLSDYFKNSIKKLFPNASIEDLNSDKLINDMSEEDIRSIYHMITEYLHNTDKRESNISYHILNYLFKLNGNGVTSFIKNNMNNRDIANHILLTSGLSDRASYYSGRGVGDLDAYNLAAIFNKLLTLDKKYAIEFVKMVNKMKTLGATEFIITFKNFANNNFEANDLDIEESNNSLEGLYDRSRDVVAFLSVYMTMERGNDIEYQISASDAIKELFLSLINDSLDTLYPEILYDYPINFDNKKSKRI